MPTLALPLPLRAPVTRSAAPAADRLAAGLRSGDPRALEVLHAEYGATVFGYLCNTLRDRGAAEDVFQQVLTEVWTRGPRFDPARGSLLGWVMTIARSRAIDELRRHRPVPSESAIAELAARPAGGEDPDALADRWRVAHLLGLLPTVEAEVLRLRFYEGFSQTEIAEHTGLALGTVKGRMVRALERLRELIDAEDARLAERLAPELAGVVV